MIETFLSFALVPWQSLEKRTPPDIAIDKTAFPARGWERGKESQFGAGKAWNASQSRRDSGQAYWQKAIKPKKLLQPEAFFTRLFNHRPKGS